MRRSARGRPCTEQPAVAAGGAACVATALYGSTPAGSGRPPVASAHASPRPSPGPGKLAPGGHGYGLPMLARNQWQRRCSASRLHGACAVRPPPPRTAARSGAAPRGVMRDAPRRLSVCLSVCGSQQALDERSRAQHSAAQRSGMALDERSTAQRCGIWQRGRESSSSTACRAMWPTLYTQCVGYSTVRLQIMHACMHACGAPACLPSTRRACTVTRRGGGGGACMADHVCMRSCVHACTSTCSSSRRAVLCCALSCRLGGHLGVRGQQGQGARDVQGVEVRQEVDAGCGGRPPLSAGSDPRVASHAAVTQRPCPPISWVKALSWPRGWVLTWRLARGAAQRACCPAGARRPGLEAVA